MIALNFNGARAGDWKVSQRLSVKETYTDNVRLDSTKGKQSDFITQINPGFSVQKSGARFNGRANYTMQNLIHAKGNGNDRIENTLSMNADAELLEQWLFADAAVSIRQENFSLFGPLAEDNTNDTGNRGDVITYSVEPYLRHALGSFATVEARLRGAAVSTGAGNSSSGSTNDINMSLASGPAFSRLNWTLRYSKQDLDRKQTSSFTKQSITANMRYRLNSRFSLIGSYGYENNDFVSIGSKPQDTSWSAGLGWTPSTRTQLEATYGSRFFGNTYAFNLSHRTRATVWQAAYSEDITSTTSQFLIPSTIDTAAFLDGLFLERFPDPIQRAQIVQDFITDNNLPTSLANALNFLTDRIFLQKSFQGSVAINGKRNSMIFSLTHQERINQESGSVSGSLSGTDDFANNNNTEQNSANVSWRWQITPRMTSNLAGSYTHQQFSNTDRSDNIKSLRFSLSRQFQPKLRASAEYRYYDRNSSGGGTGSQSENQVTVSLNMTY
ncbi:MAG: TIGR03016 family PEP-CTERM system-associated outer membrane protein [Burkholderiales bacterium]